MVIWELHKICNETFSFFTAAFLTQTVCLDDTTVKFEIWDTAGQERYHSLAPMYYRGAQAAIVVYDITNQVTYVVDQWELFCNCTIQSLCQTKQSPDSLAIRFCSQSVPICGKPWSSEKNLLRVPLCPPQIPCGLMRLWSWASAVRGWQHCLSHGMAQILGYCCCILWCLGEMSQVVKWYHNWMESVNYILFHHSFQILNPVTFPPLFAES